MTENLFCIQIKKDIKRLLAESPLFPETIPDYVYRYRDSCTGRFYKILRYSFARNKLKIRIVDGRKIMREEEEKRLNLQLSVTEIQLKKAQQLYFARKAGFNITWHDYHRFYLV